MDDLNKTESDMGDNINLSDTHAVSKDIKFKPCFKHAIEKIADMPLIDMPNKLLCETCSKIMLSHIFLIQDALDSLARKIYCGEDVNCCLPCLRQESRKSINSLSGTNSIIEDYKDENTSSADMCFSETVKQNLDLYTIPADENTISKPSRKSSIRRNSRRMSRECQKGIENANSKVGMHTENSVDKQGWQMNFLYNVAPSVFAKNDVDVQHETNSIRRNIITIVKQEHGSLQMKPDYQSYSENKTENNEVLDHQALRSDSKETSSTSGIAALCNDTETLPHLTSEVFSSDDQQLACENENFASHQHNTVEDDSMKNNSVGEMSSLLPTDDVDKISCSFPKPDKIISVKSRDTNEWNVSDDRKVSLKSEPGSEAFITICRNNSEVLGCLVLGSSLLLSRSSKTLCVLVFNEVDAEFTALLSLVFHVVQHARCLDSLDEAKEALLKKMNLKKLNIWRLIQFKKCVFLNPDTLVIRNCDELFRHDELSAVPDIGWPDCFNTGIFVFTPSLRTFSYLVELAQKQGHNNGGYQILLNSFFTSWTRDIGKKLSFIYNLMGSANYNYAPAFQKFGHSVKIVQFIDSVKPWEVKFFSHTGQIEELSDLDPTYIRYFCEWINIFRVVVLRLLPQDIYSRILSEKILCAEDIVGFIKSPSGPEVLSSPTYPAYPVFRSSIEETHQEEFTDCSSVERTRNITSNASDLFKTRDSPSKMQQLENAAETVNTNRSIEHFHDPSFSCVDSFDQNGKNTSDKTEVPFRDVSEVIQINKSYNGLPGADIGDYQGMRTWEQGQMDYAGIDNSENIIKRLQFLMDQ